MPHHIALSHQHLDCAHNPRPLFPAGTVVHVHGLDHLQDAIQRSAPLSTHDDGYYCVHNSQDGGGLTSLRQRPP